MLSNLVRCTLHFLEVVREENRRITRLMRCIQLFITELLLDIPLNLGSDILPGWTGFVAECLAVAK